MAGFDKNFQTGFDNFLRIGEQSVNAKYDIAHRPQYKDHGHIAEHYQKQFAARPFGTPVRHVSGLSNQFAALNVSSRMAKLSLKDPTGAKTTPARVHVKVNETGSLRSTQEDYSQMDGHHIDVDPLSLQFNPDKLGADP